MSPRSAAAPIRSDIDGAGGRGGGAADGPGGRYDGMVVGRGICGDIAAAAGFGGAAGGRWGGENGGTGGAHAVTVGGVKPGGGVWICVGVRGAGCGAVPVSRAGSSGSATMRRSSANSADTVDIWRAMASNSVEIRASVAVLGSPPNMLLGEVMLRR
ncbi:hypothetical protein GTC6_14964 [Gordonia terrae C-6]|uniref:Uncharacterized protein n=1 Tax=Gordonia terrae C-6 TaxID=1316928 RepID=R7Y7B7_9ACTN|nr:hypothetical protein GTC6_14964 [Gordonia terrae C-6]